MHKPSSNPQPVLPPRPKNTHRALLGTERGLEIPVGAPGIRHIVGFRAGVKLCFQTKSVCSESSGSGVIKSSFPTAQAELEVIKAASPPRLGIFWVSLLRNSSQHLPSCFACLSSSLRELGGPENPWMGENGDVLGINKWGEPKESSCSSLCLVLMERWQTKGCSVARGRRRAICTASGSAS